MSHPPASLEVIPFEDFSAAFVSIEYCERILPQPHYSPTSKKLCATDSFAGEWVVRRDYGTAPSQTYTCRVYQQFETLEASGEADVWIASSSSAQAALSLPDDYGFEFVPFSFADDGGYFILWLTVSTKQRHFARHPT